MSDEESKGLPVQLNAEALENLGNSTWTTDSGDFDILADLKDSNGASVPYEVLITRSELVAGDGFQIKVAALSDVIAAKTFANRVKDLEALSELIEIELEEKPRLPSFRALGSSENDAGNSQQTQGLGP